MTGMSSEIELKFRIPAARLAAVRRAVATRSAVLEPLAAVYFDTPGEHLARARVALRLRREASGWVQTLKAEGASPMQRLEHNVAVPGTSRPALDVFKHDGSPAGKVLRAVLVDAQDLPLVERYATEVQRTRRVLRHGAARIELALDEGQISAGGRTLPVCELELELLSGSSQALLDVAARWADRFGLVLDVRSKSERGHLLAQGLTVSPPAHARPLKLPRLASTAQALAAMRANPLAQVLANASQLADPDSGPVEPEHLHQLRVGLRRLRSVMSVFEPPPPPFDASLAPRLAALFGKLGAARDLDAMVEWLSPALRAAGAPLFEAAPSVPDAPPLDIAALLYAPATQQLWLAMLGACQPVEAATDAPPASPPEPLQAVLGRPLRKLYRQVRRDAARFTELDDASRHRLRRRIKRLRYATELSAALWPAKAMKRLLRGLAQAQGPLGEINDTVVALAHCRALAEQDPSAWFAVGWLSARRQTLTPVCAAALARLAKRAGCWRGR